MARFSAAGESAAAVADNTIFAHLQPSATVGARIRRITLGARLTTGVAIASVQIQVQVLRATNASSVPGGYQAGLPLDNLRTPTGTSSLTGGGIATTWTTPPTVSVALYRLNFNSQSGIDFPFEGLEEFCLTTATTDGLVLRHNSGAALAASTVITFSVEWEE